jgi:hypothetical protein
MALEWLGQFGPANCPPGTKYDLQSGLCFPDITAQIEAAKPKFNPQRTVTLAPAPEEKRNQMLLIAGGVVLAGLIAYAVLR